MNFSAVLAPAEVKACSDPDRTYHDATIEIERISLLAASNLEETVFEKSLKVKNTLDVYEEQATTKPSWKVLALLTNCEYRLWCLNADTPIRHNPFLTHWVEALQRLGKDIAEEKQHTNAVDVANDGITTEEIFEARVEWINRLLRGKDMTALLHSTPRELHHAFVKLGLKRAFDIQTYIQMLEEEGIYDKIPEPKIPAWKRRKEQPRNNASMQWKREMLQRLQDERGVAVQELTHLPLELPYLDFLTTLLTDRTLETHSIDPAPVITSYIQHALRLTEKMEAPPLTSGQESNSGDGDAQGHVDGGSIWEYGKEAQSRAVRLLLLFIKNLIRKELLGTEVLYFEIQEICVRYVWIKEVRDFRTWVEEGVGEEWVA